MSDEWDETDWDLDDHTGCYDPDNDDDTDVDCYWEDVW